MLPHATDKRVEISQHGTQILLFHIFVTSALDIKFQKHRNTYSLIAPNVYVADSSDCASLSPDTLRGKPSSLKYSF